MKLYLAQYYSEHGRKLRDCVFSEPSDAAAVNLALGKLQVGEASFYLWRIAEIIPVAQPVGDKREAVG